MPQRIRDMVGLLDALGVNFISDRGDEVFARCPMHKKRTGKEDRNPSWSINRDTGSHHCFSCGYGGHLIPMIMDIKQCDLFAARRFIRQFGGDLELRLPSDEPEPESVPRPPRAEPQVVYHSFVDPPEDEMDRRGIDLDTCRRYGIRWRPDKERWILPIKSAGGVFMGYQEKGPDFVSNRPPGVEKSTTLFGAEHLTVTPFVVLVESPLDVAYLHVLGYPAVASFGDSVSDEQVRVIVRNSTDSIVIALDNDEAGQAAARDLYKRWHDKRIEFRFFNYGRSKAKDPGEMDYEEVVYGVERASYDLRSGVRRVPRQAVPVPARGRRSNDRTREAPRRLRDGARQDGDHHRRDRTIDRGR